uniref:Uncharacterized protein n=1 Tax=Clastoptera arizonana TaxID=38151 RepID=A0A1B6CVI6_9HEMI
MEADYNQDLQDFWDEFRIIQETKSLDEFLEEESGDKQETDGQAEADWLVAAGYSELTEPYLEGCEINEGALNGVLTLMSAQQAKAIRRRVDTLNHTVRQRGRQIRTKHKKPDIRDVFRDLENSSTGSRSRSATPDSLDSPPPSPPPTWISRNYLEAPDNDRFNLQITPPSSFMHLYDEPTDVQVRRNESRRDLRRLPSAPTSVDNTNLFRTSSRTAADVASETADGIKILGYHRIGSVRYSFRNGYDRGRSGSDPLSIYLDQDDLITENSLIDSGHEKRNINRRHSDSSTTEENFGFEEIWKEDTKASSFINNEYWNGENMGKTWVEWLGEDDLVKLKNLVFIELTIIMDDIGIRFNKKKPHKRKRKEDTCIFGSSLSSLLEKDQNISSEPQSVPIVFQKASIIGPT